MPYSSVGFLKRLHEGLFVSFQNAQTYEQRTYKMNVWVNEYNPTALESVCQLKPATYMKTKE